MKVLLVNKFFFLKGGSETSFFGTAQVLKERGHEVIFFSMDHPRNIETPFSKYFVSRVDFENSGGFLGKAKAAGRLLYSFEARRKLKELLEKEKPDIAHLHNIHHQISPSILQLLKEYKVPVVMTLHDYKMVCPVYTLLRDGEVCEDCNSGKYYNCMIHRCCKKSFLKSVVNTCEMYLHHRILNLYNLVDTFICPSRFLKEKIYEMGFNGKVVYLPNFVDSNEFSPLYGQDENVIAYFGRLSEEKGLFTLLSAVTGLKVTCKIYGNGPLKEDLARKIEGEGVSNVSLMGHIPPQELKASIQKSMFVVVPSAWYENNPLSVLEAFALGKPVIGSRIGGLPELIKDHRTGLTFEEGNIEDLREKISYLLDNPHRITEMGRNARNFVEINYNSTKIYKKLIKIYSKLINVKNVQ